jgi:hypothetical protein
MLVDGYERLRERVLAGRPDGWRLGHGLLTGKGLAADRRPHRARSRSSGEAVRGPSRERGATVGPRRQRRLWCRPARRRAGPDGVGTYLTRTLHRKES